MQGQRLGLWPDDGIAILDKRKVCDSALSAGEMHWFFLRSSRSFLAASAIEGSLNMSIAVPASVFAATAIQ